MNFSTKKRGRGFVGKIFILMFLVLTLSGKSLSAKEIETMTRLSSDEKTYLRQLMKDTWDYIDFFIAPETGFPYDSNTLSSNTNTTNLGLYLASLAVAHHMGYISKDAAVERAKKILNSLERIDHWEGLYNNWLNVHGETRASAGPNNISDFNKLPAGVIMIRNEFPELADPCAKFLNRISWGRFHEPTEDKVFYEFDIVDHTMLNPVFFSRGEDKLLGAFLAVASGQVPASTWTHHLMDEEETEGLKYFLPGWQGGGLFMQFICGLFLDETATKLGYSSTHFAFAQIIHAQKIGSPVWGWSASEAPEGGYLGMGQLIDSVVTPHACMLAVHLFPKEVVRNLKRLEEMGARPKFWINSNESHDFGFRDSIDIKKGAVSPNYLLLDQAMAFLSLANFLEGGVVHEIFALDPMVKHGLEVLEEYHVTNEDRAKFEKCLQDLPIPFCGIIVKNANYRLLYKQEESLSLSLYAENYTPWDHPSCQFSWEMTKGSSGETLAKDEKELVLMRGASVGVDIIRYKIPKEVKNGDTVIFSAKLTDLLNSKEVGSYKEVFEIKDEHDYQLIGTWLFKRGDDVAWAKSDWDDKDWGPIRVPALWENEGYQAYDGFAWYRIHFKIPPQLAARWGSAKLMLEIGAIDDADETYLNGQMIGSQGAFPPDAMTAWDQKREYPIPSDLFKATGENVIAVRVYDSMGGGGIYRMPVRIRPSQDEPEEVVSTLPAVEKRPEYKVKSAGKSPLENVEAWETVDQTLLADKNVEMGHIKSAQDLSANISFMWDSKFLYSRCVVTDDMVKNEKIDADIYMGDIVEIYINPDNQGLVWGNPKDIQIGVTAPNSEGAHNIYAWFQKRRPSESEVNSISKRTEHGYEVITAISWEFLGVANPGKGTALGASIAVNDLDNEESKNTKLNWRFRKSSGGKIELAKLVLD